jgi:hypothetical protein
MQWRNGAKLFYVSPTKSAAGFDSMEQILIDQEFDGPNHKNHQPREI